MKKTIKQIIISILAMTCIMQMAGQSAFSTEAYMQFLESRKDYTAENLLEDHPARTTYYNARQIPADLSAIPWFDTLNNRFQLTDDEKELLSQNFFVVTERLKTYDWASAFIDIYSNDLPLFLSTDFILNSLHNSYDAILQTIEWQFLEPNLQELLHALYNHYPSLVGKYAGDERFEEVLKDVDLYISVALTLAEDKEYLPQSDTRSTYDQVMTAIEAEQMTFMKLFTEQKSVLRLKRMLAGQYFEVGDYVNANLLYSDLVKADSTDKASWLKMAEVFSFRQQYPQAIKSLERVLELDSLNLKSMMMLGDIFSKLNDSIAAAYYERAYKIYPQNQKVAYALGNWYIQSDTPEKAIPVCIETLALDSTNIRFLKLLGYAYYKAGDPRHSIEYFNEAIALGDSSAFILKFMGISQYLVIDFERAIDYLYAGSKKDSMDAEVHFFLGASLATTTRKDDAMYHLNRSLELMKPDAAVVSRIYSEQGNILRLETKYDSAYYCYEQAWEADSTNLMALYFMGSILDNSLHLSREALVDYQRLIEQLDLQPDAGNRHSQMPTIRSIVEDRIIMLREELFFLDEDR